MSKGRGIVITIKEVDISGNPTGRVKDNLEGEPDYIPPIYTDACDIPDITTTTTSTSTTTTTTRPPFYFLNSTGLPIPFRVYGLDGITVIAIGLINNGDSLYLESLFTVTRRFIRIIAPAVGNYRVAGGTYDNSSSYSINDIIFSFTPELISQIQQDYNANFLELTYVAPTTTTSTTTTSTSTTTTSSTTSTTTIPPLLIPLRYILHMIGGGVFMSGTITIKGNVGGSLVTIYSGNYSAAVDEVINSLAHYPVIDTFWIETTITNPEEDDYMMSVQVDGSPEDSQLIEAGQTLTFRLPITGGYIGGELEIYFVKQDPEYTYEWEADPDSLTCELEWDGTGTTSTTTLPPVVQIASISSNITVAGPYSEEPSTNAQLTLTLTSPAPNDINFIVRQSYNDGLGDEVLEFEVLVLSGNTVGTRAFNAGSNGSYPTLFANSLLGVPCVLGYRSIAVVNMNYNSKGCKSTGYHVELDSNGNQIYISLEVYSSLDALVDVINLPLGLDTVERISLPTTGYYKIKATSAEASTKILNLYLDDLFEDYFNIPAGVEVEIRVPSASNMAPKNIKIELS